MMTYRPIQLRKTVGYLRDSYLDDILLTKNAMRDLGYLKQHPREFKTYIDQPTIDGIQAFQRDNGLKIDGVIEPHGPTVKLLDSALKSKESARQQNALNKRNRPSTRSASKPVGAGRSLLHGKSISHDALRAIKQREFSKRKAAYDKYNHLVASPPSAAPSKRQPIRQPYEPKQDDKAKRAAFAPAIPLVPAIPAGVRALLGILGLGGILRSDTRKLTEEEREERYLQYNEDSAICRQIAKRWGARAAERCWNSASERQANCLRGSPVKPLDVRRY